MIRRDFFGSVLGIFVGTNLEFKVEAAPSSSNPGQGLLNHPFRRKCRVFTLGTVRLKRFQFKLGTDQGLLLKAPEIVNIREEPALIQWESAQLHILQPITFISVLPIDDEGINIPEFYFHNRLQLSPDDKFSFSYKICLGD